MNKGVDQTFERRMAIPEGGAEDHMEVSYPMEETHDSGGYVSIQLKGPGRPIRIRPENKLQTVSQGIEADFARSAQAGPGTFSTGSALIPAKPGCSYIDETEEFLDKSTGHAVSLEDNGHESGSKETFHRGHKQGNGNVNMEEVAKGVHDTCSKLLEGTYLESTQLDSGFRSQEEVISISPNSQQFQTHLQQSPNKINYKLRRAQAKKGLGIKKSSPKKGGKSFSLCVGEQSHAKWKGLIQRAILSGQNIVEIGGRKHFVKVDLVPVDEMCEGMESPVTPQGKVESVQKPTLVGRNIHTDGSIDRPPEGTYGITCDGHTSAILTEDRQPSSMLYENSIHPELHNRSMSSEAVEPPYNYGSSRDQPLDLTIEKPLDLSIKGTPTQDLQSGERYIQDRVSEKPHEEENGLMNVRAESSIREYRTRPPSSLSVDDRESLVGDETLDSGFGSDLGPSQCCFEQGSSCDGNLPSLGKLTLQSRIAQKAPVVSEPDIQDSLAEQEAKARAKQNQANVLEALIALNQMRTLAVLQKHQRAVANMQLTNQQSTENKLPDPQINDSDTELEIPTPAMPNFESLELANSQGGIIESEAERVRYRLKNKLQQKGKT